MVWSWAGIILGMQECGSASPGPSLTPARSCLTSTRCISSLGSKYLNPTWEKKFHVLRSERRSGEFGIWNSGSARREMMVSGFLMVFWKNDSSRNDYFWIWGFFLWLDGHGAVCPCVEGEVVMLSCRFSFWDLSTAAFSTFCREK